MATKQFVNKATQMSQSAILSAPASAPVSSKSLGEARQRAIALYREVCREVPWVRQNYSIEELISVRKFRHQIGHQFRGMETNNSRVIDMLLFKAQAEMTNILGHHFQRHHLITKYVSPSFAYGKIDVSPKNQSAFLTDFLKWAAVPSDEQNVTPITGKLSQVKSLAQDVWILHKQ